MQGVGLFIVVLFLAACGESKLQHHPIPDRLPYSGLLPDAVELSPAEACAATPLVLLDTVPVPLSEAVILQTISETRVLLIDKLHHHMTEFDWSRDRTTRIADHGRGPGFILFTSGSTRIGGFLQGRTAYDTETGGVRVVEDDHSMIASVSMRGPDVALAAIETRRNRRIENRLYRWDLSSQLIRFDMTSGQSCVVDTCDGCSYQVSENRVIKLEGESWVLYALHD